MNKLVASLMISTAVCAAAAVYFRHQLIEERMASARVLGETTRTAGYIPTPAAPTAPTQSAAATPAAPPAARATPVAAARAPENPDASVPIPDAEKIRMRESAARFLAKYENEFGRSEIRERQLANARESLSGFDRERNLDADTWEKLIELVADQNLERQAISARCAIDPLCVTPPGLSELLASSKQAIAQLIGEDGFNEMQDWRNLSVSRRVANGLSARLPSSTPLSSAQHTALAAALHAERESAIRDYLAAGQHMAGFQSADGMGVMYADQATPEERAMSAQNYVQRTRDRAATVLSGEQLTVFNQMQDELLIDLERHLRRRDQSAREAANRKP
jgi:hypothetical protein